VRPAGGAYDSGAGQVQQRARLDAFAQRPTPLAGMQHGDAVERQVVDGVPDAAWRQWVGAQLRSEPFALARCVLNDEVEFGGDDVARSPNPLSGDA
jgi:hypothetical protein